MKRKLVFIINILILIIITGLLVIFFSSDMNGEDKGKLEVIATIFPNYDFAKQIGGDKVSVKLLLNSGVESHTYEPTPKDMIKIDNSDMFIYTGEEFEPWAKQIIESLGEERNKIVDTSKNIDLIEIAEFEKLNMNTVATEEYHDEHGEESSFDSHIWLSQKNAIIMIDNILEAFCKLDPENAGYYNENAENYKIQILDTERKIEDLVKNSKRKDIAFAGEFSYSYFIDEYNLNFISVYNNCGEGEDPSISKVKAVIDYINNNNLPVVFYEELTEGTVAKMIETETKAKSMIFYTIHNADIDNDTYVSLMNKNYENLKEALN